MPIVKVQLCQRTNAPIPLDQAPILIYPQSRVPTLQLPPGDFDPETLARIREACFATGKAYFEADIGDCIVHLGQRVPDQPW